MSRSPNDAKVITDVGSTVRPIRRGDHLGPNPCPDTIAVEEPLELRVEDQAIVITMRTPGHDPELAAGFLLTEGVIEDADDLLAIANIAPNVVRATLAAGTQAHQQSIDRATRERIANSSCGICGKTSLADIRQRVPPPAKHRLEPSLLHPLPDALRAQQPLFVATGGIHGAALVAKDGTLLVVREDVGRHNAVDKVIGWRCLQAYEPPVSLLVSSRAGFEIIQKAACAGIGQVVCLGAATSLAIDLAYQMDMSLVGFLKPDRATFYTA